MKRLLVLALALDIALNVAAVVERLLPRKLKPAQLDVVVDGRTLQAELLKLKRRNGGRGLGLS